MIKVIMHGCNGRMGRIIAGLIKDNDDIEIVAGIDLFGDGDGSFPVFKKASDCEVDADVIIDFANASAVNAIIDYAKQKKLALVLCTTGLSEEQLDYMREASNEIPVLRSANMSLGINTVTKLLKEATKILSAAGFDIEIVEKHHNQKLDAPSGTALMLADSMNEVLNNKYEYNYDRSQDRKKREKKEIGISAVRGGNIVGIHEVTFAGIDEVIEIKHTAYSRAVFGNGAIQAARFLAGKPAGLYDMNNVVG